MFQLEAVSRKNLQGVHPDLVRVVERAAVLSPIPFRVTEGLRTLARQKELKAKGFSKTLNSRHITGHAVDIVPMVDVTGDGKVTGDDMWHHSQLVKLSPYIKRAFAECKVPYDWGGDWSPGGWDKPHWQLPWKKYPIRTASLHGVDADLMECLVEDPMETPMVTANMGSNLGATGASIGGAGLLADSVYKLQEAEMHFTAGNVFGMVIGGLVLVGAGLAFYTRWEEAGKPAPSFLKRFIRS